MHSYGIFVAIAACFDKKSKKRHVGSHNAWNIIEKKIVQNAKYVWFHASSRDEFEQERTLIEKLKKEKPQTKVLLTFFLPSEYEICTNYAFADVVCYLPTDTSHNAKKFISLINIEKAIFFNYRFLGNFLMELKKHEIPAFIISAVFRKKQIFFKIYGGFFRKMLKCFTHVFVKDEKTRKLLKTIDIYKVTVIGDTCFDIVSEYKNANIKTTEIIYKKVFE